MEVIPSQCPCMEMEISAMCPLTSLYFNNALISSHSNSSIQLQTPLISPRNEEPQKPTLSFVLSMMSRGETAVGEPWDSLQGLGEGGFNPELVEGGGDGV